MDRPPASGTALRAIPPILDRPLRLDYHSRMASAVLYRWRLKPGRDAEFAAAWAEGTRLIHAACGSYGARLHEGEDGLAWSYAVWPSEEARQKCFKENNWFELECFRVMQDCIAERFEEIPLSVVEDGLYPLK